MLKFLLLLVIIFQICLANGEIHRHDFIVESSSYTRLCSEKKILTVNGKFPGPTLKAYKGDTLIVKVENKANYNITIHWHGARQIRNPWADGPEYVTQCPIKRGSSYTYRIKLREEEGTIWWHAHNSWARATVHGAFIIYPKHPSVYPFPLPHSEFLIILGEWWKKDVMEIPGHANFTGGEPLLSDAFTINGLPGFLYPCSHYHNDTFRMKVEQPKTYLLRLVNAVMDEDLFFAIANHTLTLVAKDGIYLKPFNSTYIMITPGQTMDLLFHSNQPPNLYAIAIRSYSSAIGAGFDNKTTSAILQYDNTPHHPSNGLIHFPTLPPYNATQASTNFTTQFRHLNHNSPKLPLHVDTHLLFTISVNLINCSKPCGGPFGKRFSSSVNNVSFVTPSNMDVLRAYYYGIDGVFERDFPARPPREFNYTGDDLGERYLTPSFGTKVMVLEYNQSVELVLQGTNVLASDNHPIHMHGYSFYVVGWGFGNFDPDKHPLNYNLIDPPQETTIGVPKNGWAAIRFRADNPGVWLMHCHIERHQTWGMGMVFIVKDGNSSQTSILPPPQGLPAC